MNALSLRGVFKTYGDDTNALKGIDLDVPEGDFFALLGPNGAGKSTAIGIISSLVNKTRGTVSVFGHDIDSDRASAKALIGLVPQEFNFSVFETCQDTMVNVAGYNGIRRPEALRRSERLLKQLDLWSKRHTAARNLSGGMRRRLMIARSLVHEPRLLILDEPTAGVDIEIRRSMWDFLTELNTQHGTTIILTTHYLEEAESLCRNVAIIDQGEIIERGSVAELLSRARYETFVLDVQNPVGGEAITADPYTLRAGDDGRLEVDVPQGETLNGLFTQLERQGVQVSSMRNKSNRLEEFFLKLVHREDASSGVSP